VQFHDEHKDDKLIEAELTQFQGTADAAYGFECGARRIFHCVRTDGCQQASDPPHLLNDGELIAAMKQMKFVEDPSLDTAEKKLALIDQFREWYEDTGQDTVVFGPEFVIVARRITDGFRPVKLVYLTEFEGEEQ